MPAEACLCQTLQAIGVHNIRQGQPRATCGSSKIPEPRMAQQTWSKVQSEDHTPVPHRRMLLLRERIGLLTWFRRRASCIQERGSAVATGASWTELVHRCPGNQHSHIP